MNINVKKILLTFTLFLTGCATVNSKPYISFTQTEKKDDKLVSSVYYYDLENTPEKKFEFEYNSGYPLGIYDQKHDKVYFTKQVQSQNALLEYDVKHKKENIISDELIAVNHIVLLKDEKLFVVSYDKKENNNTMYPFIYDLKSKSLKRIELNPLISINDVKYDGNSNMLLISGWLKQDEDSIRATKEGYNTILKTRIYKLDLSNYKLTQLYESKGFFDQFGVDFKNKNLIIRLNNREVEFFNYEKATSEIKLYNMFTIVHIVDGRWYYLNNNLCYYDGVNQKQITKLNLNTQNVNNAIYIQP